MLPPPPPLLLRLLLLLQESILFYCKSRAEATPKMTMALGCIDMAEVIEVREALNRLAPGTPLHFTLLYYALLHSFLLCSSPPATIY